MKRLLYILVALAVLLVTITSVKNKNAIIIYSCMEQFRNDELQKQLNEHFPDDDIYVMYVSTAKAAAKVSMEGTDTDADILVAIEKAYADKIDQYLADGKKYSHQNYLPDTTFEDKNYLIWERFSGSVIINKDILEKYNLPIPESYEDFLNPIYKNLIAMPDPKSSSTGYFFLKNLVNVWGEDKAFDYFDELSKNVKQFSESGSGTVKLLIQGEVAIGLGLTVQGFNELNKGNNFILKEPEYGCPYSLTTLGLVKGRDNNPKIEKVFEYIANDFMVYDKTYFCPESVIENQLNKVPNYPANLNYADVTGLDDNDEKERLLNRWQF